MTEEKCCPRLKKEDWDKKDRPYGRESVIKEVIPRFKGSLAPIKILFITFISLLTKGAVRLIEESGIRIIEIGHWIIGKTCNRLYGYKETWTEALKDFRSKHYGRLRQLLGLPTKAKTKARLFKSMSSYLTNSDIDPCTHIGLKHDRPLMKSMKPYIPYVQFQLFELRYEEKHREGLD